MLKKLGRARARLGRATKAFSRNIRAEVRSQSAEVTELAPTELEIGPHLNPAWADTHRGTRISVTPDIILRQDQPIFTVGSCFAQEIRKALLARDFDVRPDLSKVSLDRSRQRIANLPKSGWQPLYTTATIRQMFDAAFGDWAVTESDLMAIGGGHDVGFGTDVGWLDPTQPRVSGITVEDALTASSSVHQLWREQLVGVTTVVITLGLTESWIDTRSGRHLSSEASARFAGFPDFARFELLDYEQNLMHMTHVVETLTRQLPDVNIVLTVSPVPLNRTFRDLDVVVANSESKATLRTVAGTLTRLHKNVVYWPSYEIANRPSAFRTDGRHVTTETVKFIIDGFVATHAKR